jgi:hypothetical protein
MTASETTTPQKTRGVGIALAVIASCRLMVVLDIPSATPAGMASLVHGFIRAAQRTGQLPPPWGDQVLTTGITTAFLVAAGFTVVAALVALNATASGCESAHLLAATTPSLSDPAGPIRAAGPSTTATRTQHTTLWPPDGRTG